MRVAYLTNAYPSVSHTFIRRELTELERQVGDVARFSIRPSPYEIVDPDDRRENDRTFHVLQQPVARWVRAGLDGLRHPGRTIAGLRRALTLGKKSYRGLPLHVVYFAEALLLLEEMQRQGIDHVHVHFGTNPTAVASILHAMGGPSYSFTVHGPDELDAPEAHKLGPKIEDSAFVVAITDFCAGQLRRWVGHDHWEKIRVVHCTVGDEFFGQARPIDPDSKQLVAVGRLSAQKGQVLLVEAFADAVDQGLDATLVLAGDGDMRPQIEAIARERGIEGRLRITGWITGEQVREEILASRAMVLPSFAEGLPMVIMEAFALRRPVLTTYIAGIPELVVDGENGFLIPSGSPARITEGLHRVMATPIDQLDEMGRKGQEAVRKQHYTPVETAKLADHIRRTLGRMG
ncbi:glycosyltransferase family 4 protein [Paraliomyxa miuraensis]|uniref:glycosyltransferase family 4 protein n=1 Tax=Paraliomyxa miuraensis TaxID=376150 RepID=UPI0022507312|nr:glycosyltransferase family 4 protein [Paraliomyxa miuraensis]MCX4247708.1 glycosyltransferase family 4 protein [Paraliomyxa miuraensis]